MRFSSGHVELFAWVKSSQLHSGFLEEFGRCRIAGRVQLSMYPDLTIEKDVHLICQIVYNAFDSRLDDLYRTLQTWTSK